MSNIRLSNDMVGKEVQLVKIINNYNPDKIGTIGTIIAYDKYAKDNMHYLVKWIDGKTEWETWSNDEEIEEVVENKGVKDDKEMANEEIWEMLKPKMEKNGLKSTTSTIRLPDKWCYGDPLDIVKSYEEKDVHNAIAIAYRSGYERAMKGRPFKIGEKKIEEKKKGGHWEPINPKNLPKEGTKVRYSRHIDDKGQTPFSKWTGIQIGEMATVRKVGNEFWVEDIHDKNNGYPVCSYLHPERFDMWVEDDE